MFSGDLPKRNYKLRRADQSNIVHEQMTLLRDGSKQLIYADYGQQEPRIELWGNPLQTIIEVYPWHQKILLGFLPGPIFISLHLSCAHHNAEHPNSMTQAPSGISHCLTPLHPTLTTSRTHQTFIIVNFSHFHLFFEFWPTFLSRLRTINWWPRYSLSKKI